MQRAVLLRSGWADVAAAAQHRRAASPRSQEAPIVPAALRAGVTAPLASSSGFSSANPSLRCARGLAGALTAQVRNQLRTVARCWPHRADQVAPWLPPPALTCSSLTPPCRPHPTSRPVMESADALCLACRSGDAAAVQRILAATPEAAMSADAKGQMPLHMAAAAGHGPVVFLLLASAPAAAMAADGKGQLPLHLAARNGQRDPVQALGLATLLLCFCQVSALWWLSRGPGGCLGSWQPGRPVLLPGLGRLC